MRKKRKFFNLKTLDWSAHTQKRGEIRKTTFLFSRQLPFFVANTKETHTHKIHRYIKNLIENVSTNQWVENFVIIAQNKLSQSCWRLENRSDSFQTECVREVERRSVRHCDRDTDTNKSICRLYLKALFGIYAENFEAKSICAIYV